MIIRYKQGQETFSFLCRDLRKIILTGNSRLRFVTSGNVFEVALENDMEDICDCYELAKFLLSTIQRSNNSCVFLNDVLREYCRKIKTASEADKDVDDVPVQMNNAEFRGSV